MIDVLSPTLFSIYVNDLALQIKAPGSGVKVDGQTVGILLYADDVVLLAEQEKDLQIMLNIVAEWCWKWRLVVNQDKYILDRKREVLKFSILVQ